MGEEELYKDRLALALEAAGLDLWENDLVTGEVTRKAVKTFAELAYSIPGSYYGPTIPGGLGGKQAAEQILSQVPNAFLIVSSGYSNDPIMSNYREYGFSGAIAKPHNIHKFQEVLGYVLRH